VIKAELLGGFFELDENGEKTRFLQTSSEHTNAKRYDALIIIFSFIFVSEKYE
jgi:hypothetical protein